MTAVQAMAAVRSHWQTPSATRADATRRARDAPTLLPIPRPVRNTARIKEKAYTVPPNINESRRVQTTSPPIADIPERAIARYTAQVPAACPALPSVAGTAGAAYRDGTAARARAIVATLTFKATATQVAVTMSWTRSR